jgi:hypothetical protein
VQGFRASKLRGGRVGTEGHAVLVGFDVG